MLEKTRYDLKIISNLGRGSTLSKASRPVQRWIRSFYRNNYLHCPKYVLISILSYSAIERCCCDQFKKSVYRTFSHAAPAERLSTVSSPFLSKNTEGQSKKLPYNVHEPQKVLEQDEGLDF